MGIALDDITRKKLILVRQLFQRALLQAENQHSYVDRIMALIGFDLCNETVLKAVLNSLDSRATPGDGFHSVIQQVENKLKDKSLQQIPDVSNIHYVHSLRNDAQHKVKYPNETDVSDCRTYTRDFLKKVVSNIWNEDFDSISLVDLIQDSTVKSLLIKANEAFKNDKFSDSANEANDAFDTIIRFVKSSIVGEERLTNFTGKSSRDLIESSDNLEDIDYLRNLLLISILGLDFKSYIKYKRITNFYISINTDDIYTSRLKTKTYNEGEADYILEFVTNAAIQIESLVGNISKPFET